MKKIPTLFTRVFKSHNIVDILPEVTEGMEWVLNGEGIATVKYDGACCAIIDGKFYRRYDAKQGKPIPKNAIPCQESPDDITGHFPCWIPCDRDNPDDKWFWRAYDMEVRIFAPLCIPNGTYEAVGKHFQGNPYRMCGDLLLRHGKKIVQVKRTFEGIREYLKNNYIEGLVFWKDGEPKCKIKRTDFGFEWNGKCSKEKHK